MFAVKGGRFITHMKRLTDVGTPLANFFASGVLGLRHKLGPFLWQLPFDADLLAGPVTGARHRPGDGGRGGELAVP